MASIHVPVLLHEVVEALTRKSKTVHPNAETWYLDGTLGGAGHALAIAKAFEAATRTPLNVIGLDRDPQAIERAAKLLTKQETKKWEAGAQRGGPAEAEEQGRPEGLACGGQGRTTDEQIVPAETGREGETAEHGMERRGTVILECESFRNLDAVLAKHGIPGADMILFDLGISSDELEHSGRGFTFQKDEPLLMTLGDPKTYQFTARDIVNSWGEEVIADIIFGYSEDRFARRIAKAIAAYRAKKLVETSAELAEIVRGAVPPLARRGKIHPATKTFQALRIAVNDELNALKEGLAKGYSHLKPGGRMAVISFHSLEDRIVKDFYKKQARAGEAQTPTADILTKKPITPNAQEIAENPRSRSAKLRVIEKPISVRQES